MATKAAPAVAIAGALVATAPQAHAAAGLPAATVAEQVHTDAVVQQNQPATRTYTVRAGDSLSSIAQDLYGSAADWTWLYDANQSVVHNPNDIYVGEVLKVPSGPPANTASYVPKHAAAPR